MTQSKLEELFTASLEHQSLASEYLASRSLNNPGFGFIITNPEHRISNSLTIPIRNSLGELIMVECRSVTSKQYMKFTLDYYQGFYIYNIDNALNNLNYVILTEGVMDAETFIQEGYNAVSTLRASYPEPVLGLLSVFKNVIIAFDNDEVGREQTLRAMKAFNTIHQPFYTLDYFSKDINEAIRAGELDSISRQINRIIQT